ncbi:D-alanyl-D-alanine carboxypeptidase family protein [Sulfuricaulis limicola]|uniref:D-alanyl-D-alanine carboxypeptidase family protein n=1 Tax=Sulfuricaulis limicola TaxID=1620215 RepID=UPI0011E4CF56|nr:D-alanyl-D-alanine carboxypeptidase family protein [Sulfuricaulis limicola]
MAVAAPPEIPPPEIAAPAWVLMDHHSGQVLAERNGDKALAPASLTKLMTAYVLFAKLKAGKLRLDDDVAISPQAVKTNGARLFLRPGTTARAEELLRGMIVVSANDAAVALAEHAAKNEASFVMEMNLAARALGLEKTSFVNATGQDEPGQVSTAHDLARLTSALIRDFPEYYGWFALKELTYLDITQHNHNALLWRDPHVDGVKTGHTRGAGFCLSASANRDGMRLIATVLGARDDAARVSAGQKLLEHGFRHFETRLLYAADVPALRVRLWMGDQSMLPLGVRQNLFLTLPRGWHEKLHARLVVRQELAAPVQQGQVMGTLALDLDRQPYAEYPLVALQAIGTGNILQRTIDRVQLWLQ